MKKRILSLFLAVAMVLALFPAAAFADGAADPLPSEDISELIPEEAMGASAGGQFNINNATSPSVTIMDASGESVHTASSSTMYIYDFQNILEANTTYYFEITSGGTTKVFSVLVTTGYQTYNINFNDAGIIPPYAKTYTVTFTGLPVGAVVTIGESTATANAGGVATFTNLAVGNYDYSITADGYADGSGSIEVTGSSANTQAISAVTFNGNEGATVTIRKDSTVVGILTLNAQGTGAINLPNGTYTYTATLSGYADKTDNINVGENGENPVEIHLTPVYAVTFTGNPGATVTISKDSTEVGRLTLDAQGNGAINLPNGTYTYTAELDGYETKTDGSFTVNNNATNESFTLTASSPATANYTFTGLPEGAVVTIDGNTQETANAEGVATFAGLTVGTHTYSIRATGYADGSGSIEVTSGANTKAISLTPVYAVTFNGNRGATVTIKKDSTEVGRLTLDAQGTGTINLPIGTYTYTATAAGFISKENISFNVTDQGPNSVSIELNAQSNYQDDIGAANFSTGNLGAKSAVQVVNVGQTLTVSFKNNRSANDAALYHNFKLIVDDEPTASAGYRAVVRADRWVDVANIEATPNNFSGNGLWNYFNSDLNGATVTATFTNEGTSYTVYATWTANGRTWYETYTATNQTPRALYFALSVENAYLTEVTPFSVVTNSAASVGKDDNSTDRYRAISEIWNVPAGHEASVSFVNHNAGNGSNWFNYLVPVADSASKIAGENNLLALVRADDYEEIVKGKADSGSTFPANYNAAYNGAHVKITVRNTGSSYMVKADVTPSGSGTTYTNTFTRTGAYANLYFALSVFYSYITDISYQTVDFTVNPADAALTIDGYGVTTANGSYGTIMAPGTHTYTASKDGYEDAEGDFTVSNAAVTVPVTLTAIPAGQIGKSNNTTGFFGAHSANFAVAPGQISTATFTNYAGGTEVWNNFMVQLLNSDSAEIAVLRADAYGWIGDDNTSNGLLETGGWYRYFSANWDAAQLSTVGQGITLTVANDGSYIWVTAKTTINEEEANLQYAVPYEGTAYYNLSVDHSHITGLSQTADTSLLLSQYAVKFAGETTLYYKVTVPESYAGYTVKFYKGSDTTPYRNLAPTTLTANTTEIKLPILPRDMASQFTMKVFNGDTEVGFYSVSGSHYNEATHLVYAAQSYAANAPEAAQTLVDRYVDYGKAAAWYFDGGDTPSFNEAVTNVVFEGVNLPSAAKKSGYTLNKPSVSVMFESNNSVRAYVSGADVDRTLTYRVLVGDKVVKDLTTLEIRGDYFYMATDGIAAKDLDTVYKLELYDDNTRIARITTSALGYAKLLYNTYKDSTAGDADLTGYKSKVLAQALYAYWAAAEAYFAEQGGAQ